jgi:hypothetical protein
VGFEPTVEFISAGWLASKCWRLLVGLAPFQIPRQSYDLAANATRQAARKRMMERMAAEFQDWRRRYLRLSRELRDSPYVIHG